MANDTINQVTVAKITSVADPNREGAMKARIVTEDENSPSETVYYTTPSYTPANGREHMKFTGLTSMPGEGAFVIICWNDEDKKWYYLTALTGASNYARDIPGEALIGGPFGKFTNTYPTMETKNPLESTYSHGLEPQKHTLESPYGGKFQISDSFNKEDSQFYTKMQSMTEKRVMANDVADFISIQNEHGDGLKITGLKYNEKGLAGPAPGPRDAQLRAHYNVSLESDSGSLDATVLGGYQLNVKNESVNIPWTRPLPADTKTGELNVESYSNSVNLRAFGKEFIMGGSNGFAKGVFIDASDFQGVVQIKGGKGGVEVWSNGDIDFNCAGNFNVNAAGSINLKSASVKSIAYWAAQAALPTNAATPPYPFTQGIPDPLPVINLNPIIDPGWKSTPTPNNDMLWPIN